MRKIAINHLINFFLIGIIFSSNLHAQPNPVQPAVTEVVPVENLKDYKNYPLNVKKLITESYNLSTKKLTYVYGSSNPRLNGMDCSGTIYYLLQTLHISSVPRQSDQIYSWAVKKGNLHAVNNHPTSVDDFSDLKPGDLLFWSGTYHVKRTIPITHVMVYLGKNKKNQPLMFGASNGRTYEGKKMWGVSVFDFKLPNATSHATFVGYSCIPELTC